MNQNSALSEQDILNQMLIQEKHMISSYSTFITEASCPNLRQLLTNNFEQTCEDQYQLFDCMRQKGYYQTKDAPDNDVQQAKQQLGQMRTQLS